MQDQKPDNIVYSEDAGYNAHILPYATNVGAPVIEMNDIVGWKTTGVHKVNKEFQSKFDELKNQYQKLMEEYQWNQLIYNAKFSFEPVVGELYHLYLGDDGIHFLSLIGPLEWNKEHIGTFKLNSDRKWVAWTEKSPFSF